MLKGSSLLSLEFASISPLEIENGDQDIVESTWSDIIRVCNETTETRQKIGGKLQKKGGKPKRT